MLRLLIYAALYAINAIYARDLAVVLLVLPLALLIVFKVATIPNRSFSLEDMFWFLPYVFFVVGPCQYLAEWRFRPGSPASNVYFSISDVVLAMVIVTLFYISVALAQAFLERRGAFYGEPPIPRGALKEKTKHAYYYVLWVIACVSFVFYASSSGGISNLLAPRFDKDRDIIALGASFFLASQTVATVLMFAMLKRSGVRHGVFDYLLLGVAGFLLLLAVNLVNSPRFFIVATWLPFAFVAVRGKLSAGWVYAAALLGMIFIMPILSISTRVGFSDSGWIAEIVNGADLLRVPYLDVFNTLCYAIKHVQNAGYYFGDNLLAILLFFVPRSVWPSKPYPGGYVIGSDIVSAGESGTDNLSFFLGGDLFLDFGILGVFAGGLFVGWIWTAQKKVKLGWFFGQNILSYIVICSLPILVRGPVASVLLLFSCQVVALYVLAKLKSQVFVAAQRR